MPYCTEKRQSRIGCCHGTKKASAVNSKSRQRASGAQRKESLARKLQYLFSPELCCPENCAIYRGLDKVDDTNSIDRCCEAPNRLPIEADSLGHPVGMVCSKTRISRSDDSESQSIHFATYLKAFALIYILPEVKWTKKNIENLLEEGAQLYNSSTPKSSKHSINHFPDYNDAELLVDRKFELEHHTFTVDLELFDEKTEETIPEQIIKNLKKFLQLFFGTHRRYCLFWSRKCGYLLIWKKRAAYFVFDIKGRRKSNFRYTKKQGVAMLMCLRTLDNVDFLISKLSGVSAADEFQLRELLVTYMQTPSGEVFARDSKSRNLDYKLITNDYAVLRSRLHLSLNIFAKERNRSSIMVGVAAIIASKIDHSAGWNSYVLDRIICYGVKLCVSCWESCLSNTINLDTFPTQLRIGQFVAELKLLPSVLTGQWHCTMIYRDNDFENCIMQGLEEYKSILFQIDNQMYAIWWSHQFYYLLDPYRHKIYDKVNDPNEKFATVRMFGTKEAFLGVFHNILTESNRTSTFYIHAVQLRNLKECPEGYALEPVGNDLNADVRSLNETICFSNQFEDCINDLEPISDYEIDVQSYTAIPFDENFNIDDSPSSSRTNLEEEEDEGSLGKDLQGVESADSIIKNAKMSNLKGKLVKGNLKMGDIKNKSEYMEALGLPRYDGVKEERVLKSTPAKIIYKTPPTSPTTPPPTVSKKRIVFCDENKILGAEKGVNTNSINEVPLSKPWKQVESYPSYSPFAQSMAVCGSESGTLESLKELLRSAFKYADRVLTMTPWGNFVVFRECHEQSGRRYYVFDGCTCDIDRFRHLDLRFGTAGLKPFQRKRDVLSYIIASRQTQPLEMLDTQRDVPSQRHISVGN